MTRNRVRPVRADRPARRVRALLSILALALVAGACTDDGDDAEATSAAPTAGEGRDDDLGVEFCDAYLAYLARSGPTELAAVTAATDDDRVHDLADDIGGSAVDRSIAATIDLDALARTACHQRWIAGTQGAGNAPAAAQALYDALVAGDRAGAANVAAANVLARFEPWTPDADTTDAYPTMVDVGDDGFTVITGPETLFLCLVETGVVVACTELA